MDYKFISDLAAEFAVPKDGIMSRVLHKKDEKLNVTLFDFSTSQELSTHSAPTPALLYFLQREKPTLDWAMTLSPESPELLFICLPCFLTVFPPKLRS